MKTRNVKVSSEATCRNCDGTGAVRNGVCSICEGTGMVTVCKDITITIIPLKRSTNLKNVEHEH